MSTETSESHYNRGLDAKYAGRWEESLAENRKAVAIDPTDEAGWWNLGIAATALHDWPEALRAWHALGIEFEREVPEPRMRYSQGCVRINPNGCSEVVWGERLDPSRTAILNIPLPESGRRFNDILLNDGAPEGTRVRNGVEYPVFNELAIWAGSTYSTFEFQVDGVTGYMLDELAALCERAQLGVEDWSTLRILCDKCSYGNPAEHDCAKAQQVANGVRRMAIAAKDEPSAENILRNWQCTFPELAMSKLHLVLDASAKSDVTE